MTSYDMVVNGSQATTAWNRMEPHGTAQPAPFIHGTPRYPTRTLPPDIHTGVPPAAGIAITHKQSPHLWVRPKLDPPTPLPPSHSEGPHREV
jgi:hypothetical protein